MKNKIAIFICIAVLTLSLCCGCGEGYSPEASENYYKDGEVYRVFELEADKTEHVEKYGLNSFILPTAGMATVKYSSSSTYAENSLFFRGSVTLNRNGVIAVYNCLNISGYELEEEKSACLATGLYTYNKKIQLGTSSSTLDLSEKPSFTVIGDVAAVDIYRFTYEDRSVKTGEKTGEGEFSVIVCGLPYVDLFVAYDY